jgi:hypothetical protein
MRALRRHHKQRMRKHAERVIKTYESNRPIINLFWRIVKTADNLAFCSCPGCGNPRRWWKGKDKLTIQELRENAKCATRESSGHQ